MIRCLFIDEEKRDYSFQHSSAFGLLKSVILDEMGYDISEADIFEEQLGKPYFKGFDGLHFNLSHTKGLCCCIIGDRRCGIDSELIRNYRENTIRRVFTDSEAEWFQCLDESEKPFYFFLLWTLKEAYGKFTGNGIADMKNVCFSFDGEHIISDKPQLHFCVYRAGEYLISACSESSDLFESDCGELLYIS